MKEKQFNCALSVEKNGRFYKIRATLKSGTTFILNYAFYNRKLAYKVYKELGGK